MKCNSNNNENINERNIMKYVSCNKNNNNEIMKMKISAQYGENNGIMK